MSQEIVYHDKKEMLDALAEQVIFPKKFTKINESYVGNNTLKSSRDFRIGGMNYIGFNGDIEKTSLIEQLYLYGKISKKLGIKIRHGSFRENTIALYLKNAKGYRENVLGDGWVFTGEVIMKIENGYQVRRAKGVSFPATTFLESYGVPLRRIVTPKIRLGSILQNSAPTKSGYYSDFSKAIPINGELWQNGSGWDSKGFLGHIYFDKDGLSAIRFGSGSVAGYARGPGKHFRADGIGIAYNPTSKHYTLLGSKLALWTDENPRK